MFPRLATPATPATPAVAAAALRWRVGGRVQGVGFRPFVYRMAHLYALTGWVRNMGGEVQIHAEGLPERLQEFGNALLSKAPTAAIVRLLEVRTALAESRDEFRIMPSANGGDLAISIPSDLFACAECLAELRDPRSRRYQYPFINCTQCGPRYTVIRAMPYDRVNTTLDRFTLCEYCAAEYAEPLDRRFHAEPLACANCGPTLSWHGQTALRGNAASLAAALATLRSGGVVAVRGVGGYHLMCDAGNEDAVGRLRLRKGRPAKPLAVMVPWRGEDGLEIARSVARLSALESAALCDSARPIVLATRHSHAILAASLAPGLREFGLMLPVSPLHHILLEEFGAAVVATSANLSGEPVLTQSDETQRRLDGVADGFLHHDRDIVRPAEDPVVRVVAGVLRPLRLGRGTAPVELDLPSRVREPLLAVGAHEKVTVALAWGNRAVVSPHIGDLGSPRGREIFAQVAHDLQRLYGVNAERVVHDAHPDFPNTRWARDSGLPTTAVWHHAAHAAAVAGEYPSDSPLLCFTWDGTGLGPDETLWGGEALLGRPGEWTRVGSFRPFRLPGGERAARAPWRSALALCWEIGERWQNGAPFADPLLRAAWERGVNAPWTTSVGRLFDAAGALLDVCTHTSYQGEAPMRLEALCEDAAIPVTLPLARDAVGVWRSDWAPLAAAMLDSRGTIAHRAAVFHSSLAHALLDQALAVRKSTAISRVGLCGGVFQNRVLSEQVLSLLTAADFEVLIPQRLPVNDAAISYGQLVESIAASALASLSRA